MKFGVEFASRSVSRWRNYNIDYNLLKTLIREATSGFEDSSSSDNSTATLTEHQKKLLQKLYKNFKDQIDFASLFVFSKVGEISRRLSTLKKQCNIFIKSETEYTAEHPQSDVSLRLRKRKLLLFHKELDSITNELQDLSRFILLQKIAVKKLLKKFVKYSSYPQKQSFVDKITTKFLVENPKSFIHLSLDDLALETTLLYDFLDTFLTTCTAESNQPKHRHSSIHTIDSLQLVTQSYSINGSGPQKDTIDNTPIATSSSSTSHQLFSRSTTFDIVSIRKGPRSLKFWIHKDNLDEIKFLLSSEFKLITDDSLFTKDKGLKNTRSSLNLQEDLANSKGTVSGGQPFKDPSDEFCPETDTLSVWLNNPSHPMFVQTSPLNSTDYDIDSIDNLHVFKANPYSQILVSNASPSPDDNSAKNPILITPVGGLRQFSIASLNKNLVDILFYDVQSKNTSILALDERKKIFEEEWCKADLKGNKQMMQLSLNWVLENNVKPLARISMKKLRYISLDKNEKINFYISLEWDIQVNRTNADGTENPQVDMFPHAVLKINFDVPETEFPASISSLIDSHLVYRVDNFNFSLNNYLISLLIKNNQSTSISDEEMLLFIAPWHTILTDTDIRQLPEVRAKSIPFDRQDRKYSLNPDNALDTATEINKGILLNKNDIAPSKPGYWNEFDNGSDFGGDDDGFYVYTDHANDNNFGALDWFFNLLTVRSSAEREDIESNYGGAGLDWLSQDKTNKILHWADNTRDFGSMLKEKILGIHDDTYQDGRVDETRPLVRRTPRGFSFSATDDAYSADEEDEEEYDSETEAMMRLSNKKRFGTLGLIERENHDKCLSFLYMIMVVFSLVTSSIGTLILSTIFGKSQLPKPQMTAGLLILVLFAIACLLLSIILSGFSICLLLCRYIPAPTWHLSAVWVGTLVATTFFFYGIVTCF